MKQIGLLLPFDQSWGRELVPGFAARVAETQGYQLRPIRYADLKHLSSFSGLIVAVLEKKPQKSPEVEALLSGNIPVVNISGSSPPKAFPLVTHDNREIGKQAALHLLEQGLTHFAVAEIENNQMAVERTDGFVAAIQKATGEPVRKLQGAFHKLGDQLTALRPNTGIFGVTDTRARHVTECCYAAGISCPETIAVIGCDNDPLQCEFSPTPLSSVEPDFRQVGYQSMDSLLKILSGQAVPPKQIIPPLGVIQRRSSAFLRSEDPMVRRAMLILEQDYDKKLSAPEVASRIGVSIRHFHRRFKEATGKTFTQVVQYHRLLEAKRLLEKTHLRISEVAYQVGINDPSRFPLVFQKQFGLTPREFRRQKSTKLRGR